MKSLVQLLEQEKKKETEYPLEAYIHFRGIPIEIENKKGSYREGIDENGKKWKIFMNADYGRIALTSDNTNEMIDVYIGPNNMSEKVFIIAQLKPDTGEYDEKKYMLGFDSAKQAKSLYLKQYTSPKYFGGIKEISFDKFRDLVFKNIVNHLILT